MTSPASAFTPGAEGPSPPMSPAAVRQGTLLDDSAGKEVEVAAADRGELTLGELLAPHGLSVRLATMLATTELGSTTLRDFTSKMDSVTTWMLQQKNCGRKTLNELLTLIDAFPGPSAEAATRPPEPPLEDVSLGDLLAADDLSMRLYDVLWNSDLHHTKLSDYVRNRDRIESWMLRQPNCGRKSVMELRQFAGAHAHRQIEGQDLDPTQFGEAFAEFVDAAPATPPDLVGPPTNCDLRTLVQWHLGRLPERTADIISLRFGLGGRPCMTLAEIGDGYGVTRERIRQIEAKGIKAMLAACRRFPVAPHVDGLTPRLVAEMFAPDRHATSARIDKAIAELDGWLDLAMLLARGGARHWLAANATPCGKGWLAPGLARSEVKRTADQLRSRASGMPFPRVAAELTDGLDVDLVGAAMDLLLDWRVDGGYTFPRRPGPRLRRTASLHALMSECGRLLEVADLLRRYHERIPGDPCTDRDLVIVMEAATHLFVEIYEGCWAAIGAAALLPAAPAARDLKETAPEADPEESTIAVALERELARVGPSRMGALMARAIDILPEGRSRNSVGPTLLLNPTRFVRVLPGVYALPHQVLDGRELIHAGALDYLLNANQARFFAMGRMAGEPWSAFPLWTPAAEMRLCRWVRAGDNADLYRSLLAVASIDEWPTDAADREAWTALRARDARYELWCDYRIGARPPIDRVVAAAIQLSHLGSLGWVGANRILGYRPDSCAATALLGGMAAAGMVNVPAGEFGWQMPHTSGPRLAEWSGRLIEALHRTGVLDWRHGVGADLAAAFDAHGKTTEVADVADSEELDEYETMMAEHRRAMQARRIEARIELLDA